jgi:hypothetical protein
VFVLANVLRRPIVVYADDCLKDIDGVKIAPVHFAGVRVPQAVLVSAPPLRQTLRTRRRCAHGIAQAVGPVRV